ncbi:arrestin domain-containing protein, partial [Euroglyphus maynei]
MICLRRTIVKVTPLLKISVRSLEIVFDRENATYFGGESITGHCKVSLIDTLDVDKIRIKFFGQAKTYLETNKSRNAIERERLFQQYFLPKHIPVNIPSTFKYTFDSHIKYKIKAIFGLTTKYKKITILTNPNISISQLLLPVCASKEKKIGLIGSRSVSMKCRLSRIGFTVGKSIPVMCCIENRSNKLLTLKAILHQQIFLMALSERKVCCRKIHKMIGPNIKPNFKFEQIINVALPEQLPIVFDTCNLVHINYILDVYLDIPMAELPFQFVIPNNMPSTFNYKRCAFIEYRIKAMIGGKTKELDVKIMGFPSVSPNELYAPVQDEQSKTVGLFNRKKLTMRCNIPQAGWTMGSTIPINCSIDNYSDKMMTLSASIKQDIQVLALNQRETHREKILATFGQQVPANRIGGHYLINI